ncbi:VOC family protein [Actinomycetospora endophytica]|uniref:VOC family protein n=1 Tax=Actinomycetospora endophytica TaxID=2291215 RepID=A0ABS8P7Z3_9PSEU|nr:VOC family protein [Actinomycetospora endophytica]MCD2194369.1 VOC family protein [Actinomycetospora endophytica]
MARPVVHFEVTGRDPESLRGFFGELFDWRFDVPSRVADGISDPDAYGFLTPDTSNEAPGIPGGVGGGPGFGPKALFYVSVEDVDASLAQAERLGGKRVFGPAVAPSGLVVGHFADPEGNLIGLAAPPR